MRVLIIHCHPEPQSFNATLSRTAHRTLTEQGHAVRVSDLYGEGFQPVEGPQHYSDRADPAVFSPLAEQRHAWQQGNLPADVQREIDRLEWAELLILQFPLWWHGAPALLKGWFDRVMVSGGLYTSRMRYDAGYFRGRRALLSVTTGAPATAECNGGVVQTTEHGKLPFSNSRSRKALVACSRRFECLGFVRGTAFLGR